MGQFDQYLQQLHPSVRGVAQQFLEQAVAAGLDPRVQEAYRSRERQDQLYAQGRSAPGAVVTKAKGGQSNHNYGVAMDVVPGALVGTKNWSPESPLWDQLGQIGQKAGIEWGGTWDFVDKPHFQLKGASWRKMQTDPNFSHFRGDGHSHSVSGPPQAPGTPAPAMGPPVQVADRPIAPIQPGPAGPAPQPNAPDEGGGLGAMLASPAPAIGGADEGGGAPMVISDSGMGATMAAQQSAEMAKGLPAQFMPDIERILGLGKRPVKVG